MKKAQEIREQYRRMFRKKPKKKANFAEKEVVYRELREREKKQRREGLTPGERIVEELRLPSDMLRNNPIITQCGRCKVVVENYKKLTEYEEESIRILTGIGTIRITGKRLQIVYYTEDVLKIVGYIKGVEVVS